MNKHYQVLALKYRPRTFAELVGQKYIIKTLENALNTNNLHNGFLFTGTRGVGKTTIARILAKSMNCDQGISSKPCGVCNTCLDIDKGESIDLIELDAASHTGIDNMRDILENTHYLPTKNRYKIYLIDEVHMLSKSSFNALLKTLEEPPKHVKFLFATTDHQKLPITILSRCLQFTLNTLSDTEILKQLEHIMQAEKLKYEKNALAQIAHFGNGSMRDAISLLDQSITYSNGEITTKNIKDMLALVSNEDIITLTKHLFAKDPVAVIGFIKNLVYKGENLSNALKDLISMFHQITLVKIMPSNTKTDDNIKKLANQISNYDLQLFYQIAINGSKDLIYAPSEQIGLEMTLLRMIAFHSDNLTFTEKIKDQEPKVFTENKIKNTEKIKDQEPKVFIENKIKNTEKIKDQEPKVFIENKIKNTEKIKDQEPKVNQNIFNIENQQQWQDLIKSLKFNSAAKILIKNTVFNSIHNQILTITLDKQVKNMLTETTKLSLEKILTEKLGKITLKINIAEPQIPTIIHKEKESKKEIRASFLNNQGVKKLKKAFDAKVDINSIKEIKNV